ncbi:initiation factor 2B-like protein [Halalkalicoccus sp. NIPERK01]|uniref:initiation factor 2B-like protein n=1 Tax=Halalkalicoccus sp. NIPERK01 TaxID=3053469 RepID=UPI00256EAB2A|nr:initiation factor 2B-like protein [Halalkalicoccus sp. NIPERK01]MDL5361768.1 initiation factor 2B-like protein [Halalkalicoccus sp. NIPERK01]
MVDVVVCFLRADGRILLYRRENERRWRVPSAEAGGEADGVARRLCREWAAETTHVRAGDPVEVDGSRLLPYLFECEPGEMEAGIETAWVHATEIRRRETVEGSWRAYRSVSPTVGSVRDDRTHGSAYVSVRALEVLRDRAGEGADWTALAERATALLEARPSMAALGNRIDRAMWAASEDESPAALERAAWEEIDRALAADGEAAENAAERLEGTVLTLSRSGTVAEALSAGEPERVVVLESRPDREGVGVAERLAESLDVTLTLDAAVAHLMEEVDVLLVLADGGVVNKVGTRTAAVVAAREGVPAYAVAAADKISPSTEPTLESVERGAITESEAVTVECPLFDRTPPELVSGVITEDGVLDAAGIRERAREHERRARWKEPNPSEG